MLKHEMDTSAPPRLLFVDALRAVVATLVAWHHFALYGPLSHWALAGRWIDWVRDYRSPVQVFFVVSGYVMARSMSRHTWHARQVGCFVVRRYCRLGLPYLAAVAVAVGVCAMGRGWLPESVVGHSPKLGQVLAHVVFLQDVLGYESLSAGLWFVCIDFQLGLMYVGMLYLRDAIAPLFGRAVGEGSTLVLMLLGWALSAPSLFFFNLEHRLDVWAVYFFGQFFMGVMVYHGLKGSESKMLFWLYVAMVAAALVYCWRWRLAISLLTGLMLFAAGKLDWMERWPASRVVGYLGRTSYSLYLIHFPVLVAVSTLWVRFGWSSWWNGAFGLIVAYFGSLAAADGYYRAVEAPAARLGSRFS